MSGHIALLLVSMISSTPLMERATSFRLDLLRRAIFATRLGYARRTLTGPKTDPQGTAAAWVRGRPSLPQPALPAHNVAPRRANLHPPPGLVLPFAYAGTGEAPLMTAEALLAASCSVFLERW